MEDSNSSISCNFVSDLHKYVVITFRKSGLSTMRKLFVDLHYKEFSPRICANLKRMGYSRMDGTLFHVIGKPSVGLSIPTECLSDAKYDNYYKYIVVRNTFSRVCSMYFDRHLWTHTVDIRRRKSNLKNMVSFAEFVDNITVINSSDMHFSEQFFYGIEALNFNSVCYLENLESDLLSVYSKFGIEDRVKLFFNDKEGSVQCRTNKNTTGSFEGIDFPNFNFAKDQKIYDVWSLGAPDYNFMYNDNLKQIVREKYRREIKYFGFEYPWEN